MKITQRPSPNFTPRRHGRGPDMVVLHHTAMESCEDAVERLCNARTEVSAHYVLGEKGEVYQLVDEGMRAWHAGAGQWGAVTDVNSNSIGIELANAGPLADFPLFPDRQMAALGVLLKDILDRHRIKPERVIAHSDMAPERKFDPGPKFDWQSLAVENLSIWPDNNLVEGLDPAWFREYASAFGYDITHSDEILLGAFRLRFRPDAIGPIAAKDLQIIQNLARRFPVDLPWSKP